MQQAARSKLRIIKYAAPASIAILALPALFFQLPARAEDNVSFTGFMSIVGGRVLSGDRTTPLALAYGNAECPCYIADWNHMATYGKDYSFSQESRAGIRMNAKLDTHLDAIVQVDARGTQGSSGATLEWAYLAYEPADDWLVQLGRKRLPIYYYSDFMDVGFAYPWVRAPTDLYGWEVNNFNGITFAKTAHWESWDTRTSLFYGREDSSSNILTAYFYPGYQANLSWKNILGADFELTYDWFNMRMVYIQSRVDITSPWAGPLVADGMQYIYGAAFNFDYADWVVRSEFSLFDRWKDMGYQSSASMVGVGYHFARYTPMLTHSNFYDQNSYGAPNAGDRTIAVSLRYDLTHASALKIQYDILHELSQPNSTTGNARIISASFDQIF